MEIINIEIIISSLVVVVLLWLVIGRKHLIHLAEVVHEEWEKVDERLRKRHNIVPNLIETVRKFTDTQEELLTQLIEVRMKAARESNLGLTKVEHEYDLARTINKVVDLGALYKDLSLDTNFLELRKEIDEIEKELLERVENYNKLVREYNHERDKAWMAPIAAIFSFEVITIFEVEV